MSSKVTFFLAHDSQLLYNSILYQMQNRYSIKKITGYFTGYALLLNIDLQCLLKIMKI